MSKQQHRTTGWAAPRNHYAVPVLFNPYTGEPRDVRDVQSDPQGILIVPPGKVEMVAAQPAQEPVNPYPEGSPREAWRRGFEGHRNLGAKGSDYDRQYKEGAKAAKAARAQPAQEPQQFGDLTGVAVCCGEYAKCHRPCTPRGVWMANETYLKAQERKPLTDEQIAELFPKHLRGDYKDLVPYSFARAIEQAHGIGSKT